MTDRRKYSKFHITCCGFSRSKITEIRLRMRLATLPRSGSILGTLPHYISAFGVFISVLLVPASVPQELR